MNGLLKYSFPICFSLLALFACENDGIDVDDIEVPAGFARYQRLFEIVTRHDDDKATARERMAFYKDRGYPITYRKSN